MQPVGIATRPFSILVTLSAVMGIANGAVAQAPSLTVQGVGLQTPESVLYDAAEDVYLVSNINGNPAAADGNGFISRIGPDGQVLALKWIDGTTSGVTLHAPKGMAIAGDTLYVADITAVRMFDRRSGQPKGSVAVPGATFLNDAAAGPDGSVYVTDSGFTASFTPSGSDAVHRIDRSGALITVARGTHLRNPNGTTVLADGTVLVVGGGNDGELFALGPGGQRVNVRRLPAGGLDGVEALPGGVLLVSSWGASAVFRVAADGRAEVVVSNVRSPADIGYDGKRNRVLIPLFQEGPQGIG
jgi:sugar lactone lactonase YvrE